MAWIQDISLSLEILPSEPFCISSATNMEYTYLEFLGSFYFQSCETGIHII